MPEPKILRGNSNYIVTISDDFSDLELVASDEGEISTTSTLLHGGAELTLDDVSDDTIAELIDYLRGVRSVLKTDAELRGKAKAKK